MTRRALLLVLIPCAGTRGAPADDFPRKILAFEKHWNEFLLGFYGCRPISESVQSCTDAHSSFNHRAFTRARDAARKLFDLRD